MGGNKMDDQLNIVEPPILKNLREDGIRLNFTMSCDKLTGNLLRTLATMKPSSHILELGTGIGFSTSWILDGMDKASKLVSVEMDSDLQDIAKSNLRYDERVNFITQDGSDYIKMNLDKRFDIIFADTWPGKFYLLDEVLQMLTSGGIYLIDDLLPVENWSEGHQVKVDNLIDYLENRKDLYITKLNWSTGLIMASKK
jgi:predicted O-methyltransferase YrrM